MGEELAAFLNTMKALDKGRFLAVEKALQALMPQISGIELEVSDLGEVELRLKEGGIAIPSRVLSEGALRMLGLLALTGAKDPPALAVKRAGALGARKRDRGLAALGHEQVRFQIGSAVRAAPFYGPSRRRVIRNRSFQPRAAACTSARKPCRVSMRSQRGALRSTTSFS